MEGRNATRRLVSAPGAFPSMVTVPLQSARTPARIFSRVVAAAIGSDEADDSARIHVEIEVDEGGASPVLLPEVFDVDDGR